ncbi:MAG: hypothetical protein WBB76_10035 [Gaiellaceae bacterium]
MTRISGLASSICAALTLAGAAQGGMTFGVSEDRGKNTDPASFFATLKDLGFTDNRATLAWDPSQPDVIPGKDSLALWLPLAQAAGVRIVFSVSPLHARDLSSNAAPVAEFATFLQLLAKTFPQVKDYVIGNEPNQPYFWLPQYGAGGKPVSAASYERVLAQSYDALKAIDPTINVIGIGLSPRGNDDPRAIDNISRSPVRFLHDLGVAYRASHRTKPLMDELSFHPYPHYNSDPPAVGYRWPNAGIPNLGRIRQAVWDAFNGTAQPTFAEQGKQTFAAPLRFELDEIGWQVAIPPSLASLYQGVETEKPVSEISQARYYSRSIKAAECDPSVRSLSFFLLLDEPNLSRWQSGLERLDGSHRPSYDAVKQTIAQTQGKCQGKRLTWTHTTHVDSPVAAWQSLMGSHSTSATRWSFSASAGEEVAFRAGIFNAGTSNRVIARALAGRGTKPLLSTNGKIKARKRVIAFPQHSLKRGRYVVAISMQATMNPSRTSLLVSRAFTVAKPKK